MAQHRKRRTVVRPAVTALSAALAMAFGPAASATQVAPYFYTWGWGDPAYKSGTLAQAKQNGQMDEATLAFGVAANGACVLGGGMENLYGSMRTDVQNFLSGGGRLILS